MALPNIKIEYGNGALGQTIASSDGLLCIAICGISEVKDTFTLAKPYSIRKLADLEEKGITEGLLHAVVKDFYREAEEGTQVYVVGYPGTLSMSDILDKDKPYLKSVIEATNGELRGLVVSQVTKADAVVKNGLNEDLSKAMLNAQALGDWSESARYAPIFTVLDGLDFSGDAQELTALKTHAYNRVAIVIGSTEKGSKNQAVGLVAGRIARASVDNNIGRVRDGALNVLELYASDKSIELADVASIHDKGYITFRTFTGIAGYFISDDTLATKSTDDYNHLTARRTIDKAYRIAYAVLVNQLLDKLSVKSDGTLSQNDTVAIEQMVVNAITTNMTSSGELSDDGDGGVQCFIDPTQDILATSKLKIELRVRPFGYARYIDVLLGFTVNN